MSMRGISQQSKIIGHDDGGFRSQQPRAMGLRVGNPSGADLVLFRIARVLVQKDDRMSMIVDGRGPGFE